MTAKRIMVLLGSAALVVLGVVGLSRVVVPDEATFSEDLEEATETPEGFVEFMPDVAGAELDISGARDGSVSFDQRLTRPSFGFGSGQAKVFFDTHPLMISQLHYDGLAFFPEPEDCEFDEGQRNEDAGLVAVEIGCPELTDIRGNGAVSVNGHAALPVLMVREDIPKLGGEVSVGDDTWAVGEATLIVGRPQGDEDVGLHVGSVDSHPLSFFFSYDLVTGELSLTRIFDFEGSTDVPPDACEVSTEQVASPRPDSRIFEMQFSCDAVETGDRGVLPMSGTVVFERLDLGAG